MILYPYYRASHAEAESFLLSQRMGRLVTRDPAGSLGIGLYPYLYHNGSIELHLVLGDAQVRALRGNPQCIFQVDEVLSFIPSYWEDPDSGRAADAYYRFASCRGTAALLEQPAELATHLGAMLRRNQPEGGHRPITSDDPMYLPSLQRLVLLRIGVEAIETKFKLGQNVSAEVRRRVILELRNRQSPGDLHTAEVVEAAMEPPPK